MLDILKTIKDCYIQNQVAAIATIINTEGSTYRSAGAKSLILTNGKILGTLSGGCVEGDIYEHALQVMESSTPKILRYDFRGEGDLLWGLGVGCNGSLQIWLEPFDPIKRPIEAETIVKIADMQLYDCISFSVVTVISSNDCLALPIGSKFIFDLRKYPKQGMISTILNGVSAECFVECIGRVPRLFVFGAGPDASPLVRIAKLLQWHVTVIDHRPGFANKEHFQDADEIIVSTINTYPENLVIPDGSYAVVMTHHFQQDALFINQLISKKLNYLGILGPRKRTVQLLNKIQIPQNVLHSPIGLDIGAEAPEEIALSILSEILCFENGRSGQPLRHKTGQIHERTGS